MITFNGKYTSKRKCVPDSAQLIANVDVFFPASGREKTTSSTNARVAKIQRI